MNDHNHHPHVMCMPDEFPDPPDPKGIGYIYFHSMLKHADRIAQIDGITGEEQTFDALLKRSIRVAITMRNKGIEPGDFISVCSFNHLDSCVPYLASFFTGAIMAAVEPCMSAAEIIQLLEQVYPKIIFVSNEAVALLEEIVDHLAKKPLIVVFGETSKYTPFSTFVTMYQDEENFRPREAESLDEIALIVFSSGTTGRPKGICHTHTSILSNNMLPHQKDHVIIVSFTSLYWSIFPVFIHISVSNGLARLVFPRFDFNDPWRMLKYKIHFAFLNPIQGLAFTKHAKPDYVDVANLDRLLCGGNYATNENILKIKAVFPKTIFRYGYGQSETFTHPLQFPWDSEGQRLSEKYINSVGSLMKGYCCKVVDIETEQILGPNQQGELRLKSNVVTTGYYNQDSSEMFDSEGWLKTGDIVYYNEEKCFFVTNRIKESFKYLNQHIIPRDIEGIIIKHPAVETAVVLGYPHETDSNHPMAVVVLKKNVNNVTAEEIVKFVEETVEDKNRLRAGVRFTKNLPLTVTNKIKRFDVRQMVIKNEI